MTDPDLADATYVEPITPEVVAYYEKEKPDAILPTMGGQTALNTAIALAGDGTLDKYGVQLIGADLDAINMAEDRLLFREAMDRIGLKVRAQRLPIRWKKPLMGWKRSACRPSSVRLSRWAAQAAVA